MKKFLLVGLASTFATILTTSLVEANGRYCLHYTGNPHCVAVLYDQNYGYAPPPPMYYENAQIIYVAPPAIRYVKRRIHYAQPYVYYDQYDMGSDQFSTSGGSRHSGGGMGGGKNGGGKNGG